jgi:ketosteroid isomerase-like protein
MRRRYPARRVSEEITKMATTTDTNTTLVQTAYAEFKKGDIPSLLDRLTDDISWITPYPREIVPFGGHRTGKHSVQTFFEQLSGSYEITKFEPHDFVASGDRVVAMVKIAGVVRDTGVHVTEDVVQVFRLRNGKFCEFREYADTRPLVAAYTRQASHARN